MLKKFLRFAVTGLLNTGVDILALNVLLWLSPPHTTLVLLVENCLAYTLGAVNSYLWNKYWTFTDRSPITMAQIGKFALVTLGGMLMNSTLLALLLHLFPGLTPTGAGAQTLFLKAAVAAAAMFVSFAFLCLMVFVAGKDPQQKSPLQVPGIPHIRRPLPFSLSVVLPAYNEAQVIRQVLGKVLFHLTFLVADFEIIVVDDGSKDGTGDIIQSIRDPRLHLVRHFTNRGYGGALHSGFAYATKDLVFFMDSDDQFDIRYLPLLLGWITQVDAVFGYRLNRQDTSLRKLNAWLWSIGVKLLFGVRVRDIDCAYKLFRRSFVQQHLPHCRGAMVNTEVLHTFRKSKGTYKEVGIPHFPRKAGKATGASPLVILRALGELVRYRVRGI